MIGLVLGLWSTTSRELLELLCVTRSVVARTLVEVVLATQFCRARQMEREVLLQRRWLLCLQ